MRTEVRHLEGVRGKSWFVSENQRKSKEKRTGWPQSAVCIPLDAASRHQLPRAALGRCRAEMPRSERGAAIHH